MGNEPRPARGWYVLLLAWVAFAAAFFAFARGVEAPADVANARLLDLGGRFGPLFGVGLGALSFLASGIVYLIVRLIRKGPSRTSALVLTALGHAPWLVFGWSLLYREPRYTEIARAVIGFLGKPMLYSAAIVCGATTALAVLSLVIRKKPSV